MKASPVTESLQVQVLHRCLVSTMKALPNSATSIRAVALDQHTLQNAILTMNAIDVCDASRWDGEHYAL